MARLAALAVAVGILYAAVLPARADDSCDCSKKTDPTEQAQCIINCKPTAAEPIRGGTAQTPAK